MFQQKLDNPQPFSVCGHCFCPKCPSLSEIACCFDKRVTRISDPTASYVTPNMPNSVIPSITDSPFLSYHDNIGVEFFCDFAEGRKRSFHSGMKKWNRFLHLILDDLWDSVCKERKSRRFRITTFARLRLELMKKYYFHLEMNPLGIPEVSDQKVRSVMDKIAKTLIQFGHTQVFIPNALLEYEDSRLGKSNGLKDFGAFTLYDMMKINKSNNPGISFLRAKGQARTKIQRWQTGDQPKVIPLLTCDMLPRDFRSSLCFIKNKVSIFQLLNQTKTQLDLAQEKPVKRVRRRKETIARHRREQTEDLLATVRRTAVPIVEKPHPADPSSIELELNHTSNRRIKKMQEVSILAVARCHQQRRRVLEAMEKDVKDLLIADYKDTFRTSLSELEQIAFAIGAEVINYDDKKDFWQTVLETPDVFFNQVVMDVAFAEAKKMWKGTLAAPHEQKFEIFHNKVEDETKLISKNILVMRAKFLPKERYDQLQLDKEVFKLSIPNDSPNHTLLYEDDGSITCYFNTKKAYETFTTDVSSYLNQKQQALIDPVVDRLLTERFGSPYKDLLKGDVMSVDQNLIIKSGTDLQIQFCRRSEMEKIFADLEKSHQWLKAYVQEYRNQARRWGNKKHPGAFPEGYDLNPNKRYKRHPKGYCPKINEVYFSSFTKWNLKEFLKAREKGTQIAKQFLVNLYKDENWGEFVSFHHDTEIEGIRYKNLEVRKRPDGCMHFSEGADHIAENIYGIDTHEPVYFELRYQLKTYKPKKENRTYRMTTKPSRLFASESKYYAMDDSTLFRTVKLFAPQQYNNFCAKMARIKRNPPANFGFASQNNLDLIEKWKNAQLEEGKKYWIELMNKRGPWAGETSYVSLSAASSEDLKTFEMLKKGDYQGREIAITKIAQKMDNDEVSTAESILLSCK